MATNKPINICVVLFQSMTVNRKHVILFAACQHSIFQSILQLNNVINRCSIYFINRRFEKYSFQSSQCSTTCCFHSHMTVDSCTREFVWSYSFAKQQQEAQQCEWQSINMVWVVLFQSYDCRLKLAWVCLFLTVFTTTQTWCLIAVQPIVSIHDF